jgi:hypothetical protein
MRRLAVILYMVLAISPALEAQHHRKIFSAGGGRTWTLVQSYLADGASQAATCGNAAGTTCTVVFPGAVTAGHLLTFSSYTASVAGAMSSINTGGTFVAINTQSNAGIGTISQAYILSETGGGTTFTITFSTVTNTAAVIAREYSWTGGGTASLDTNNSSQLGSGGTSPFNGQALTLTGASDVEVQTAAPTSSVTAVAGPYTDGLFSASQGNGDADLLNVSTSTTPSWTAAGSTGHLVAGMAFK